MILETFFFIILNRRKIKWNPRQAHLSPGTEMNASNFTTDSPPPPPPYNHEPEQELY